MFYSVMLRRGVFLLLYSMTVLSTPAVFAASIESLVMPGPLTESHAEFEDDCTQCHARFDKGAQENLCLNCHEEVSEDIAAQKGFHGKSPQLAGKSCTLCHSDHLGREQDISAFTPGLFDHSFTDFPLAGVHVGVPCAQCHTDDQPYRAASVSCESCHADQEPHGGQLGEACGDCHSATHWAEVTFDHAEFASFALTGGHAPLLCDDCHSGANAPDESLQIPDYEQASSRCVGCHESDDVHQGGHGQECAECHTSDSWSAPQFDHSAVTGFELSGGHQSVSCAGCHLNEMQRRTPPTTCVGCHGSTDPHQSRNGEQCDSCHSVRDWNVSFDHQQIAGFALQGAHESLTCEGCHRGSVNTPIDSDCQSCHAGSDPHGGAMATCDGCHNQTDWAQDVLFHHDLTAFPLLGSHRIATCEQCHRGLEFSRALAGVQGLACVDCHRNENPHGASFGSDCSACHTPVAWSLWQFEHNQQTDFLLDGAHEQLTCEVCHMSGTSIGSRAALSTSCGSCHRQDDAHQGSFGPQCSRCHSTEAFTTPDIRRSQ